MLEATQHCGLEEKLSLAPASQGYHDSLSVLICASLDQSVLDFEKERCVESSRRPHALPYDRTQ